MPMRNINKKRLRKQNHVGSAQKRYHTITKVFLHKLKWIVKPEITGRHH